MPDFGLDPSIPIEGILMAFDFGTKRIGLAIGQTLTSTANPLTTLAAQEGIPNWEELDKLIAKWEPNALIVGIPLNMDGTEQPITEKALIFAKQLKERYALLVFGVDERLTSFAARQAAFEAGGYKQLKKTAIDSRAAQIILESWMSETSRGFSQE